MQGLASSRSKVRTASWQALRGRSSPQQQMSRLPGLHIKQMMARWAVCLPAGHVASLHGRPQMRRCLWSEVLAKHQ